jgi:hypothetical protein
MNQRKALILLNHLDLDSNLPYDTLMESDAVREALARSVGLQTVGPFTDTSYVAIAEAAIEKVEAFLGDVRAQPGLSSIKQEPVSLDPDDFLR